MTAEPAHLDPPQNPPDDPADPQNGPTVTASRLKPVAGVVTAMSWREAVRTSSALLRQRPTLVAVGLLGFLARGGIVVFLLPIVALPTPTGISTFIGGTALTGSGASEGLIRLIVVAILLVVTAVIVGTVLGAISDIVLAREAIAVGASHDRGVLGEHGRAVDRREALVRLPVTPGLVLRLLVVRAITLLPVALAVAWGTTRLVAAGYHQLILPDDLTLPLAVRILVEASGAAVVVLATWLVAEFVGGVAVREVIVGRRSAPAGLAVAIVAIARRPLTSLATYLLGVIALAAALAVPLLVAASLWSRLQALLADDVAVPLLVPATVVFVAVWIGGLLAVGVVTAWRGILGTLDVLRARRVPASASARAMLDGLALPTSASEVALQEG